jgi:hypothetical protein
MYDVSDEKTSSLLGFSPGRLPNSVTVACQQIDIIDDREHESETEASNVEAESPHAEIDGFVVLFSFFFLF